MDRNGKKRLFAVALSVLLLITFAAYALVRAGTGEGSTPCGPPTVVSTKTCECLSDKCGTPAPGGTTAVGETVIPTPSPSACYTDCEPHEQLLVLTTILSLLVLLQSVGLQGWRRAVPFFALTLVTTFAAEAVSLYTSVSGAYCYSGLLGPQVWGVPLVVPLSWYMMLYPSLVITQLVLFGQPDRRIDPASPWLPWLVEVVATATVCGLILTAWDLTADPYMSLYLHAWTWFGGEDYFTIPFANYYNWVTVVVIIIFTWQILLRLLSLRLRPEYAAKWFVLVPIGVYACVGLADVLVGYPEDTRLLSPFSIGLPVLLALYRWRERTGDVSADTAPGAEGPEPGTRQGYPSTVPAPSVPVGEVRLAGRTKS